MKLMLALLLAVVAAVCGAISGLYWYDIARGSVGDEPLLSADFDPIANGLFATAWAVGCLGLSVAALRTLRGVIVERR